MTDTTEISQEAARAMLAALKALTSAENAMAMQIAYKAAVAAIALAEAR